MSTDVFMSTDAFMSRGRQCPGRPVGDRGGRRTCPGPAMGDGPSARGDAPRRPGRDEWAERRGRALIGARAAEESTWEKSAWEKSAWEKSAWEG